MTVYRRPDPIPLRSPGHPATGSQTAIQPVRPEADDLNRLVARQIFQAILGGRFAPASILPNEHQLAADLGVSRTALREAIKGLVAKGVLQTRRKRGTQVLERSQWNMLDSDLIAWSRREGTRRVSEELWDAMVAALGGLGDEAPRWPGSANASGGADRRREAIAAAILDLAEARHNRFIHAVVATSLRSLLSDDPGYFDMQVERLLAQKQTA